MTEQIWSQSRSAEAQYLTPATTYTFRIIEAIEHILSWCASFMYHTRTQTRTLAGSHIFCRCFVPISSFIAAPSKDYSTENLVFLPNHFTLANQHGLRCEQATLMNLFYFDNLSGLRWRVLNDMFWICVIFFILLSTSFPFEFSVGKISISRTPIMFDTMIYGKINAFANDLASCKENFLHFICVYWLD